MSDRVARILERARARELAMQERHRRNAEAEAAAAAAARAASVATAAAAEAAELREMDWVRALPRWPPLPQQQLLLQAHVYEQQAQVQEQEQAQGTQDVHTVAQQSSEASLWVRDEIGRWRSSRS